MITSWRIVKTRYAATAFDGSGARRFGGRWNSPGVSVVYTAETVALAILELLLHLGDGGILRSYSLFSVRFDEDLVTRIQPGDLPVDWRAYPAPQSIRVLGDSWVRKAPTPVMRVPGVIYDREYNYVLNPSHPSYSRVKTSGPQPLLMDPRLREAFRVPAGH